MMNKYRGYLINTSAQEMVGGGYRGGFTITRDDKTQPEVDGPIELDCAHATGAEAHARAGEAAKAAIDKLLVLKAFQVGDCDIVAAFTPEGAFAVLEERCGENEFIELDDVAQIEETRLDAPVVDDEGQSCPTIRQRLAELTEPAYLFGWE